MRRSFPRGKQHIPFSGNRPGSLVSRHPYTLYSRHLPGRFFILSFLGCLFFSCHFWAFILFVIFGLDPEIQGNVRSLFFMDSRFRGNDKREKPGMTTSIKFIICISRRRSGTEKSTSPYAGSFPGKSIKLSCNNRRV